MTWHNFQPSSDDDSECVNPDCGVIVADDTLDAYSTPCPAPECTDSSNRGNACVIVRATGGPRCSYCGKRQGYDDDSYDEPALDLSEYDIEDIDDLPDQTET